MADSEGNALLKVQRGDVNGLRSILSSNHSDINLPDDNGFTLIHHAIDLQENEILQLLLNDARTDLEAKTLKGLSILHLAATNNLVATKAILTKLPQITNGQNNWQETPLHLAAANQQTQIVEV